MSGMNPVGWLMAQWGARRSARVQAAYRRVFRGEDAEMVLADLAAFTKASESTFVAGSPDLSAHFEGARRVWLHIASMLDLDPRAIPKPPPEE